MEAQEINFALAIFYGLVGWLVRVTYYYFHYDKDTTSFSLREFWKVYDRYIIVGFSSCLALAFLSDIIWLAGRSYVGMGDVAFDERVNIFLGFLAILILMFFDRKAKTKFDENK